MNKVNAGSSHVGPDFMHGLLEGKGQPNVQRHPCRCVIDGLKEVCIM